MTADPTPPFDGVDVSAWKAALRARGHLRAGYSAAELIEAWDDCTSMPEPVAAALAGVPALAGSRIVFASPEHPVAIPGGRKASETDLFVLARAPDGALLSMAVEGKAREAFGPLVSTWRKGASRGKVERLAAICGALNLPSSEIDDLRYQLLHRSYSAVAEARRFGAERAMMLVHSFDPGAAHFADFARFTARMGAQPDAMPVSLAMRVSSPRFYLGWVSG